MLGTSGPHHVEEEVDHAYNLLTVTSGRLDEVERNWRDSMGDDPFDSEFAHVFAYAREVVNGSVQLADRDASAYSELRSSTTGEAVALIDLIHARGGQQMKLVHFHYGPQLWDYEGGKFSGDAHGPRDAMTSTMTHLLEEAKKVAMIQGVKVYGRSNEHLRILTQVADYWPTEGGSWRAVMQGRWLAFLPTTTGEHA